MQQLGSMTCLDGPLRPVSPLPQPLIALPFTHSAPSCVVSSSPAQPLTLPSLKSAHISHGPILGWAKLSRVQQEQACLTACRAILKEEKAGSSTSGGDQPGKAFEWEIKGANVEQVWAVTGEFLGARKWMQSLVQSCVLVEGEPQKAGCVRKAVLYNSSPGTLQPLPHIVEKLLEMDELHYRYRYTTIEATLPGFSLMQDYVSTFKLSPRGPNSTLLHWSFVYSPASPISQADAYTAALSLYQAAVGELKSRLYLSADDCVALF